MKHKVLPPHTKEQFLQVKHSLGSGCDIKQNTWLFLVKNTVQAIVLSRPFTGETKQLQAQVWTQVEDPDNSCYEKLNFPQEKKLQLYWNNINRNSLTCSKFLAYIYLSQNCYKHP